MTGNQFLIQGGWESRAEDPAALADGMLRNIDALRAIIPDYGPWWVANLKTGAAIPLEKARPRMKAIVASRPEVYDDGEPVEGGIHTVIARNERNNSAKSLCITLRGGAANPYWRYPNKVEIETGDNEFPDPSIVSYPVFKAVTLAMVEVWRVAFARVFSRAVMSDWRKRTYRFDLSWMTYLSAPLAAQITPPAGVVTERFENGGLLLIAAEETFDVDNIQHMDAARAIRDALEALDAIPDQLKKW